MLRGSGGGGVGVITPADFHFPVFLIEKDVELF